MSLYSPPFGGDAEGIVFIMKKLLAIFTGLLLFSNVIVCQPLKIEWQQCLGGSESEYAYDITQSGNGYMIIGYTYSNDGNISHNHGDTDTWLVKIDSDGSLLWEKSYGGSEGDGALRIFEARDSHNLFLVGGSNSIDGDISTNPYPGTTSYWILKIDSIGNIIWDRIVGGTSGEQLKNACPTSDGGLVALGYTSSSDGDISIYYGGYDMWVIKLNSDGTTDWDFSIGTALGIEFGKAVIQTSDGGYLIGGSGRPEGYGNITCVPHSWKAEAILFKLDSNGNEEWQQCYGGSGDEGITGLIEVDDGYLCLAYSESNDGDVSGFHGTPLLGIIDIWIIKIDFSGNIIWENCYGGFNDEVADKIFQTSDGGFIVFGITHSNNGDVSGNHSLTQERPSIWVFKINSTGQLLWQQCIGGIATERIRFGAIKKSDYNFVVAGEMMYGPSFDVGCSNHGTGGSKDYWVFEISDTTNIGIDETPQLSDLNIFPNPANTVLYVDLPQNYNIKNAEIEIVDICGKIILRTKPSSVSLQIDITQLKNGLFFIRIRNDKTIFTKKFLKL